MGSGESKRLSEKINQQIPRLNERFNRMSVHLESYRNRLEFINSVAHSASNAVRCNEIFLTIDRSAAKEEIARDRVRARPGRAPVPIESWGASPRKQARMIICSCTPTAVTPAGRPGTNEPTAVRAESYGRPNPRTLTFEPGTLNAAPAAQPTSLEPPCRGRGRSPRAIDHRAGCGRG